jgi:hypothetical protein
MNYCYDGSPEPLMIIRRVISYQPSNLQLHVFAMLEAIRAGNCSFGPMAGSSVESR